MTYPSGKKNVLVTGGAGFIGSHLCDELVKYNHVICVDNFITGSEKNIDHLFRNSNFKFIRHDINEPLRLEEFPELKDFKAELQGVQEIYNLACPTSPREYNNMPIETLLTNSVGTYNILVIAKKYKASVLHLSTSAIYGDIKDFNLVREDNWGSVNPVGPRSCYNEGKRFAESLVYNFHTKEGINTKIARIFNTFGPRMRLDDGRMIPDFIVNALNNNSIIVYGSENEVGSYCYIEDLIDGIIRLMASDINVPINLGSDHPVRLGEIAKKVVELTSSTSKIEYKEQLPYTSSQVIPDIGMAKESLGWFPMVSLIDGLAKTIENMKVNMREFKGKF
jgi:UDP-glucuronate decarboxylase